jgi:hypothetical protein
VELFERLRREYEFGIGTVKGVARTFGVHRRMVRQAVESALPPLRGYRPPRKPALGPWWRSSMPFSQRMRQRLASSVTRHGGFTSGSWPSCRGVPVAESTVRNHVRERGALGRDARPTFVPQSYAWGSEAQVDWYEATAELGDDRVTLQVFCMRSMASGAAFHRAYPRATQQAFLEANEHAFAYFGGVHRVLRYDNLGSAVRKILRGHRREETVRFVAFRSHWRFEAQFCTPAAGHEKGGVEGEVGYFRRNHWVPVPSVADLDELNRVLLAGCRGDERRLIDGRERCVGEALAIERDHLLAVAEAGFDLAEVSFPLVNASGCITVHATLSPRYRCGPAAKCRPASTRPISRSGTAVLVSPDMSAVTAATNRFWTSTTTSTFSSASRARWPAPSRSSSGAAAGAGRPTMTRCGGGSCVHRDCRARARPRARGRRGERAARPRRRPAARRWHSPSHTVPRPRRRPLSAYRRRAAAIVAGRDRGRITRAL